MANETSFGLTLVILVTIAGQEIAHLVHAVPALAVMGISLAGGLCAYARNA